jgi:hypothetical protein
VDHSIELQITTCAAKLLIAMRNSKKPRCLNIPFGLIRVEIVDEKTYILASLTKGNLFAIDLSM